MMESKLSHRHKACQASLDEHGYKLTACCQCNGHRCHRIKRKDLIKVIAGHLGGKVSPANFKNNKELARQAGERSAWAKHSGKLADFPLFYEDTKK